MKGLCGPIGRSCWYFVTVAVYGMGASSAGAVSASFDIRLAGSESDAVLDLTNPADQTLDLEMWLTLEDGPLAAEVLAYSFYLEPSVGNIVSFVGLANTVSIDEAQAQGIDNTPLSGAFSRGVFFLPSVAFDLGERQLATFSVSALNPGMTQYFFAGTPDDPQRPWRLDFDDFSTATMSAASPAFTIEVIPEPGAIALMALALGSTTRTGTRRGRE